MNPCALYDALNCASTALIADEGSQGTAPGAFPPGPLADALNLILGAVGGFAREVSA